MTTRTQVKDAALRIRNGGSTKRDAGPSIPLAGFSKWTRVGRECPGGRPNSVWVSLTRSMRRVDLMARILASPAVPREVFDERMAKCRACEHVAERDDGKLFCLCCGCPALTYASLDEKNTHSLHRCTAQDARFLEYTDG